MVFPFPSVGGQKIDQMTVRSVLFGCESLEKFVFLLEVFFWVIRVEFLNGDITSLDLYYLSIILHD